MKNYLISHKRNALHFNIHSSAALDNLIKILKAKDFAGMKEEDEKIETEDSVRLSNYVDSMLSKSDSVLANALKSLCNEPLDID